MWLKSRGKPTKLVTIAAKRGTIDGLRSSGVAASLRIIRATKQKKKALLRMSPLVRFLVAVALSFAPSVGSTLQVGVQAPQRTLNTLDKHTFRPYPKSVSSL